MVVRSFKCPHCFTVRNSARAMHSHIDDFHSSSYEDTSYDVLSQIILSEMMMGTVDDVSLSSSDSGYSPDYGGGDSGGGGASGDW